MGRAIAGVVVLSFPARAGACGFFRCSRRWRFLPAHESMGAAEG